jgi:hypothetical protein
VSRGDQTNAGMADFRDPSFLIGGKLVRGFRTRHSNRLPAKGRVDRTVQLLRQSNQRLPPYLATHHNRAGRIQPNHAALQGTVSSFRCSEPGAEYERWGTPVASGSNLTFGARA